VAEQPAKHRTRARKEAAACDVNPFPCRGPAGFPIP
jgi:hypothetical protein